MKREIKYIILGLLLVGILCAVLYSLSSRDTESDAKFSKAPSRLTILGPYAKNINLTENIGAYSLNISAETLFMKKGKIMGFSTALHKKLVTNNFRLSLYKNGTKTLELFKDHVILDAFMRTIEVDSPKILYPPDMNQPKKVSLDKRNLLFKIHYKDKTDVWNLAR